MTIMTEQTADPLLELPELIPVLPLRDVVVYPHMVIPLFVGRSKSMRALEEAMNGERQILLVAQHAPDVEDPEESDLYRTGTVAAVLQMLKLPDGTVKVLAEGRSRVQILRYQSSPDMLQAEVQVIESSCSGSEKELEVISRSLIGMFEQLLKQSRKLPPEIMSTLSGIDDPGRLADTIAWGIPAGGRSSRQAVRVAQFADYDPSAFGGYAGSGYGHRDPSQRNPNAA